MAASAVSSVRSKYSFGLTAVVFILLVFGLVMLSSAGIVDGQRKFNSGSYYVWHQLLYGALPGLVLFFALSRIRFKKWRHLALILLVLAIVATALVFVPGIGYKFNGAYRWIRFGPLSLQPAEPLKLALIIYLAAWFAKRERRSDSSLGWFGLVPLFVVVAVITGLLIKQPDLGTLGILIIISGSMFFLSGASLKRVVITGSAIVAMLLVLAVVEPYRFERIRTFLDPTTDRQGAAYHINQALISIGSGGIFGLGYGQSRQKFSFLPEPVGDSIFAIVVEELGLIGGLAVLALFIFLLFILINIARRTEDAFGRLFVLGMAVWIVSQAFINIAAISGLIPLTGVPLPFISYGSSSLVSILAGLGIVRNISAES
jgi:cell division protein FtsW